MAHNGPLVSKSCHRCTNSIEIRLYSYNLNIKKNGKFLCSRCAKKQAGANGSYNRSGTRDLSQAAKDLWQDNNYASKVSRGVAAAWSDDKRAYYAEMMRQRWKNELCRQQMLIGQQLWFDTHKDLVSISNSKGWSAARRAQKALQNHNNWNNDEFRQKLIYKLTLAIADQPRISSLQLKLYEILDELTVHYHKEGPLTVVGHFCFDGLIPSTITTKNILIECQGEYWHSLPKAIAKDRSKFTYIDRYFPEYEILYLWEHEFNDLDRIRNRLKAKLRFPLAKISYDFRDVLIKEISAREARDFIDAYHYIGGNRGGVAYGAFLDNILIACAVYSPPVRQGIANKLGVDPNDLTELSRFCIHPVYQLPNLASWFLAFTIRKLKVNTIVSYADQTAGHSGTIYKAANFKLHHHVNPDYWYIDYNNCVMHKKTLYNQAINLKLTENEFAEKYGYIKKWGGPKLCFVYHRPHTALGHD